MRRCRSVSSTMDTKVRQIAATNGGENRHQSPRREHVSKSETCSLTCDVFVLPWFVGVFDPLVHCLLSFVFLDATPLAGSCRIFRDKR
jgi:hypothetical protein